MLCVCVCVCTSLLCVCVCVCVCVFTAVCVHSLTRLRLTVYTTLFGSSPSRVHLLLSINRRIYRTGIWHTRKLTHIHTRTNNNNNNNSSSSHLLILFLILILILTLRVFFRTRTRYNNSNHFHLPPCHSIIRTRTRKYTTSLKPTTSQHPFQKLLLR